MITENAVSFNQEKSWLEEYSVDDLARALMREFCVQNRFQQTLSTFQTEDIRSSKKIHKSALIRMLQMNNLVYWNKQSDKPFKSLLEVLVNYLKNKFKDRIQANTDISTSEVNKNDYSDFEEATDKLKQNSALKKIEQEKSLSNTLRLQKSRTNNNSRVKVAAKKVQKEKNPSVAAIYAELHKVEEKEAQRRQQQKKFQAQKKQQNLKEQLERERNRIATLEQRRLNDQKRQQELENELIRLKRIHEELEQNIIKERTKNKQIERLNKEIQDLERKLKESQKLLMSEIQRMHDKHIEQIAHEKAVKAKLKSKPKLTAAVVSLKMEIKKQIRDDEQHHRQMIEAPQGRVLNQVKQNQVKQSTQTPSCIAKSISQEKIQPVPKAAVEDSSAYQVQQPTRKGGMRRMLRKTSEKQNDSVVVEEKQQPQIKAAIPPPPVIQEKVQLPAQKETTQGPKMVRMFGKKKREREEQEAKQQSGPTKFKFDDNFVDKPLHSAGEKYEYEALKMNKVTLEAGHKPEVNYAEKKLASTTKKYPEKGITEQQHQQLKKIVFQGGLAALPKAWQQGFILSPHPNTPYGLQQIEGGPCGIIAALQCYFLKHILHMSNCVSEADLHNQILRQNCLVAALADILLKCKSGDKITLCLPPKSFSGAKVDISCLRLVSIDAGSFEQAYNGLHSHKTYFIGKTNHGVTILLYSIIMTKGIANILQQIDMKQSPLIGNHGHCTQQLVNLFITGQATSNCFDNDKVLQGGMTLRGIKERAQFGFLTIFQTLKYIEVGKNLKNPYYPIWIICKEFHYHVIFANHYLISQSSNIDKFDIVYFDGLYNCADRIVITLEKYPFGEQVTTKAKDLPLIEQVMMTKWGERKSDWNGSIKIL